MYSTIDTADSRQRFRNGKLTGDRLVLNDPLLRS